MSSAGYSRIPTDNDSDGVPDQSGNAGLGNMSAVQAGGTSPALDVNINSQRELVNFVDGDSNFLRTPRQQQQQWINNSNLEINQPVGPLSTEDLKQFPPPNPMLMIITIIATIFLAFVIAIPVWFCIFPALLFSILGYNLGDSPREDQRRTSKLMNRIAIGCNIAALVTFVLLMVLYIILIISFAVSSSEHVNHHQYHDYID